MRTNISIFREYIKNSTNMRKEFEFIVFIPHKTLRIGFPILSLNLMQGHNWKTVFIGLISVFWIKFINVIYYKRLRLDIITIVVYCYDLLLCVTVVFCNC